MEETDFACTIDPAGLGERVGQLASLVPQVLTRRREESTFMLEFRAEAAREIRDFVADESRCCPFLSFDVDETDRRVRVAISAPPGGQAMLKALEAAFAGDGTKLRASFEAAT